MHTDWKGGEKREKDYSYKYSMMSLVYANFCNFQRSLYNLVSSLEEGCSKLKIHSSPYWTIFKSLSDLPNVLFLVSKGQCLMVADLG